MEYVFFSGGFDSTAFLLECLFVKKVETTPIVVTDPDLDGKKFHWTGRECSIFEEDARRKRAEAEKLVPGINDQTKRPRGRPKKDAPVSPLLNNGSETHNEKV